MVQLFRSTCVVTPEGVRPATLEVDGGRIVSLCGWDAATEGAELRDYGDRVLMPGLVDSHVHINEPGRTEWEGFATATTAAAAGGVTTLVDMPLNCVPETIDAEALEAKRKAADGKVWVDWAAWGGVVRGNAEKLPGLMEAGVPGFKCFLIHSGIDGFAWTDERELRAALQKLKGTGLPLLAHAEVADPVEAATRRLNAEGADWRAYRTYLASRPDEAELDAIALLLRLAEEYATLVHIVHLATAQALPMLAAARARGVPVTVETCAQYLWFAAEEIPDGATEYKCAPPIRLRENREALWQGLLDGVIDMITTDHSPCPPEMKSRETGRWDRAWGGIASLGLALPVVWTAATARGMAGNTALERISQWMAARPARLAGMAGRKGVFAPGADADIVVFDPDAEWRIEERDLRFRHKLSPYLGAKLRGRVCESWLRGERVFNGDGMEGRPRGRELVRQ